ncbi:MAG: glucose-6-phosphate isomerase [Marinirhabdus sp.]|nr:glucose-6-phosphate isomerase [Marinirhabdus sp.]
MPLPTVNPTSTKAWKALQDHYDAIKDHHLRDLFKADPNRAADFSLSWKDFYVDVSKNRITPETRKLLLELAEEVKLKEAIAAQFSGMEINATEQRAVLHTALRDFSNMKPEVAQALQKMKQFSEGVISGRVKGYTGKSIQTIVNIGIGGSDLGPQMVCEALSHYKNHLGYYFVSNVDGDHVAEVLKKVDPETTVFIIVSKSFTTQETLRNAQTIRNWFLRHVPEEAVAKHFVAVSTNLDAVASFGIHPENVFPMWDWVGGRFSLWSTVGLSICCVIGYDHFEALLKGAHDTDRHFSETPFSENIPVALGLISVWYNNFFQCETEAVIPYCESLSKLTNYLQQAVMESNGKGVGRNGKPITYQTGNIVWGATGTNAQHAFFQLLHQGTKLIPTEFICFAESLNGLQDHQNMLLANCLAQTEALAEGNADASNPFKNFTGNRPSTTLLIQKLTPKSLGALLALYEHKLFVQGVIWNIFSYDQWGVQLGKVVAETTLAAIENHDASLLKHPSTKAIFKNISE